MTIIYSLKLDALKSNTPIVKIEIIDMTNVLIGKIYPNDSFCFFDNIICKSANPIKKMGDASNSNPEIVKDVAPAIIIVPPFLFFYIHLSITLQYQSPVYH